MEKELDPQNILKIFYHLDNKYLNKFFYKKIADESIGLTFSVKQKYPVTTIVPLDDTIKIYFTSDDELVIKCQLIHLLLLVYKYYVEGDPVYGSEGELFKCMIFKIFGDKYPAGESLSQIAKDEIEEDADQEPIKYGSYIWWEESCYIDSVLMILLLNENDWWRHILFYSDLGNVPHNNIKCSIDSELKSEDDIKKHTEKIRKALVADYQAITSREAVQCTSVRRLLAKCFPQMRPEGNWEIFGSYETYSFLASLFNMTMVLPLKNGSLSYQEVVPFVDYLSDDSPNPINWNLVNSPTLTFANTGTTRPKILNKKGIEKGEIGLETGETIFFEINKTRAFEEKILGKYELVGACMLQGILPGKEGGTHYVSYVKIDGEWYFYNDLKAMLKRTSLPTSVWREENLTMPSIYFYALVK